MKVRLINMGYKTAPTRAHYDDVGADVYSPVNVMLQPHSTTRIPLGFGLELPNGYGGFIYPRSGLSSKGIVCELPPIDPGYTGEIHAIVTNVTDKPYWVSEGDRVGQLVITPVVIADFVKDEEFDKNSMRGDGAFASTGK